MAIELNPGSDLAHREYGCFLSLMGRFDEGLDAAHARHRDAGARLQDALPELGFRPFALDRPLPQLTSVWLPDGVDDAKIRSELLVRFGIEVEQRRHLVDVAVDTGDEVSAALQAFIAENSTKAFDLQLSLPLRGAA